MEPYAVFLQPGEARHGHLHLRYGLPALYARLPGHPYSWPRPKGRKGQGGYVRRDHPAVAHRNRWVALLQQHQGCFGPAPVRVVCRYHYKGQIGDGDNMDKLVWDALQVAGLIENDRQIVQWGGRTDHIGATGRLEECTELEVHQLAPQQRYGAKVYMQQPGGVV